MEIDYARDGLVPADKSLTFDEYRSQIHPDGMVPALVVNNQVIITEMTGVLTYIAALAEEQGKHWLPSDGLRRAKAYEWISWLSGTVHGQGFTALWRAKKFSDDENAFSGIQERARRVIEGCYERIEARLAANEAAGGGRGFAVGEEFSVVDVLVYLFWRWAERVGFERGIVERWPRFAEVARRVELLGGTREAMEIEKQGLWFS